MGSTQALALIPGLIGQYLRRAFLARVLAIGKMLYDREGDFREGAFSQDGELAPAVVESCARLAVKVDPRAPKGHYELAKALLCQSPSGQRLEACDRCPACIQLEAGTHPDFFAAGRPIAGD